MKSKSLPDCEGPLACAWMTAYSASGRGLTLTSSLRASFCTNSNESAGRKYAIFRYFFLGVVQLVRVSSAASGSKVVADSMLVWVPDRRGFDERENAASIRRGNGKPWNPLSGSRRGCRITEACTRMHRIATLHDPRGATRFSFAGAPARKTYSLAGSWGRSTPASISP